MQPDSVRVTYHAQEQVKRLSDHEITELNQLLSQADEPNAAYRVTPSGHRISRLGNSKNVLWRRDEAGQAVVLSVVDRPH